MKNGLNEKHDKNTQNGKDDKKVKAADMMTRDTILKMLSDDEVAKVSTAETAPKMAEGDEYVDLEQLPRGVQHAHGAHTPMQNVLPRKAVHEKTWSKILKELHTQAPTPTV